MDQPSDNARQSLDDIVVQRLFAAGLDLQAALVLTSDHGVAEKIDRAISQLDHAIRDLRDTIFDRSPSRIPLGAKEKDAYHGDIAPDPGGRSRISFAEALGPEFLFPRED